MAEAATATISVNCKCGKKLKAPASAVGKKAKCPKCGNVMTVPAPPPAEDDSLDALYDLAAEGEQAVAQQQLAPRCPGCQNPLTPGAVLCTNCGFDTRTGKSIASKTAAPAAAAPRGAATGTRYDPTAAAAAEAIFKKSKGKPGGVDMMAPQASYFKGLAGCIGGAAIGGIVWFLIAYFTGYELYFVVLGVGALAGAGMQWGQQGYSYVGGFTAAGVTFATMVLARLAVIAALILPAMRSDFASDAADEAAMRMPDLSMYDERIVERFHMEELQKLDKVAKPAPKVTSDEDEEEDEDADDDAYERREIAAYQAVEQRLKKMPKAEHDAMVKKLDKQEQEQGLQHYLTREILLKEFHYHPARAGSVLTEQASKSAKERIAAMTEAQRESEYKRLDAEAAKEREKMAAEAKARAAARRAAGEDDDGVSGAAVAIGGIVIFFLIFGGFKGMIFTLLALGLAFRTASGSVSD